MASSASVHGHKRVMVIDICKVFESPYVRYCKNATLDIELKKVTCDFIFGELDRTILPTNERNTEMHCKYR